MKEKQEKFEELVNYLNKKTSHKKEQLLGEEIIGKELNECVEIKNLLVDLFPMNIKFIELPIIIINSETGNIIEVNDEIDKDETKTLITATWNIKSVEQLMESNLYKSNPNLYIYGIKLIEFGGNFSVHIRAATYNLSKKKITLTVSEDIYEEFTQLSNKLAINKSKFVENKIKEFISNNR